MDLPRTVHPSRLSPHFVGGYAVGLAGALLVAGLVFYATAAYDLSPLPFDPAYLYGLALLPLVFAARAEARVHEHEYEFHGDRVLVREGHRTIEQEDVPYSKITDVSSVTPPYEDMVDVGDLEIHIAGAEKAVDILGVRHPDRYEDLMLGRERAETGGSDSGAAAASADAVRRRMRDLERQYDRGEIGRAEYERNYYYLQGKLDALEGR